MAGDLFLGLDLGSSWSKAILLDGSGPAGLTCAYDLVKKGRNNFV